MCPTGKLILAACTFRGVLYERAKKESGLLPDSFSLYLLSDRRVDRFEMNFTLYESPGFISSNMRCVTGFRTSPEEKRDTPDSRKANQRINNA